MESLAIKINPQKYKIMKPDCLIVDQDPNWSVASLLQKPECMIISGNRRYYYLIADLGSNSCLQIVIRKKIYGSHHWLLTVVNDQNMLLQLRMVSKEQLGKCDAIGQEHPIREGVISWRYLFHS